MRTYKDLLTVGFEFGGGTKVTKVTKKPYGYIVKMFNHYITLYSLKVVINENGSAKINWTVDKNYQPTIRFTTYYNTDGVEITRSEYQKLNKI